MGKVGLHAWPISLPLKSSQRHPEEPMKTCPHRAEAAWPLFMLAGSSLVRISLYQCTHHKERQILVHARSSQPLLLV